MNEARDDPASIRAAASVDIASRIFSRFPTPLPAHAFGRVATTLFELLARTEDRDVTQSGLDIITTVIRKDVAQLLDWYVEPLSRCRSCLTDHVRFRAGDRQPDSRVSISSSPSSLGYSSRQNRRQEACSSAT